jgi:hypothetical protein
MLCKPDSIYERKIRVITISRSIGEKQQFMPTLAAIEAGIRGDSMISPRDIDQYGGEKHINRPSDKVR